MQVREKEECLRHWVAGLSMFKLHNKVTCVVFFRSAGKTSDSDSRYYAQVLQLGLRGVSDFFFVLALCISIHSRLAFDSLNHVQGTGAFMSQLVSRRASRTTSW